MPAMRKYDWEGLFKRQRTKLVRGIDYKCSQSSMAGSIRNEASKRRLRIRLIDEGESITVEVVGAVPHTDKVAVTGQRALALE